MVATLLPDGRALHVVWTLLAIIIFATIVGFSIVRPAYRRVPNRLNDRGLRNPRDQDRHGKNDRE